MTSESASPERKVGVLASGLRRFGLRLPEQGRWLLHRWGIPAVALLCLAVGLAATAGHWTHWPGEDVARGGPQQAGSAPALQGQAGPRRIEPLFSATGSLSEPAVWKALDRLERTRPTTLSNTLHVVRFLNRQADYQPGRRARCDDLLDTVLDHARSEKAFGRPTLIDTREGVRCRTIDWEVTTARQWEREAHSDQLLAYLAELGVPLARPVSTRAGRRQVGDLLEDALGNFTLQQAEIEWSALAFALYLDRPAWRDKFGQEWTFDQLAEELMSRRYSGRACGGTHLLHSLTVLVRSDAEAGLLSPACRGRALDYLRERVRQLLRTQTPEGSWRPDWHEPRASGPAPGGGIDHTEVQITGHHLEWLMLLPQDLRPPRDTFLRAMRFLQARLLADPERLIRQYYCPYSHAGYVLLVLNQSCPGKGGQGEAEGRRDPSRVLARKAR